MANATPSRMGQINGAGDALAIFLKVFGGEVLSAYERQSLFRTLHTIRQIASGKSAQFPATGLLAAYTHVPGEEILGEKMLTNEQIIAIEGLKIAAAFIPSIDDAMAHYDYRSPISSQIGQALAKVYDQDISMEFANAARTTTPLVNGVYSGDALVSYNRNASYATDGAVIFAGIQDGNVVLDMRDIPKDDRFFVTTPTGYALLVKSEKPFDYIKNDGETGLGGLARGVVKFADGVPILKSNNYVNTNRMTDTSLPTRRQHDYSTSAGILGHKSAVGTVQVQDITMEAQWDIRRQGWLSLGKMITGHGVLRPEAAYELQNSASAPAG